jgi:hypothetical protein
MLTTIQEQIEFLKSLMEAAPENAGAGHKSKRNYQSEIIHHEHVANADKALETATFEHAKAVKADERLTKTRERLQVEMQNAAFDLKAASDAVVVADTTLKTAQASAYRGKAIGLGLIENAYSKAAQRHQILTSAIESIQVELDELPTPTAKIAAIELRSAQECSKKLKQWHLDRKVAIAVHEAVAHADSLFVSPSSYCAGFDLGEHLSQLTVFKHEVTRKAKSVA